MKIFIRKQHEKEQLLQIAQFKFSIKFVQKFLKHRKINIFNFCSNENRTRLFQVLSFQIIRVRIKSM